MFPEITTSYIISQAIGLVAIAIVLTGYFVSTKKKQLVLSIIANIAIALSFLFLGTYTAFLGIIIATIRTIIFFVYELRFKQVPTWLIGIIFLVLILNNALVIMETKQIFAIELLPMISLMLYTVGFRIRRLVYMRLFFIIPIILFLIYDIYIGAFTDIILKISEFTAIIITSSKFFIRKNKLSKIRAIEELQGSIEEIRR